MQLKWGNYPFTANSTAVGLSQAAVLNDFQVPWAYDVSVDVAGRYTVTSQTDAVTKERALIAAMARNYQRLTFFTDTGRATAIDYHNANTLGGVVITNGPSFNKSTDGQYATVRDFTFTATFRVPILNADTAVLRYKDAMDYTGGGPVYRHKSAVNGLPQKQMVWRNTPYRIVHSGEAIGFRDYPVFRALLPACLMEAPAIHRGNADRFRTTFVNYPIRWTAIYESAAPMNVLPTVWNPR